MNSGLRIAMIMAWTMALGAQTAAVDHVAAEYRVWRESVDTLLPQLAALGSDEAAALLADVEAGLVRQHEARRAVQQELLRSFSRFSDTLPPASKPPSPQVVEAQARRMRQAALHVTGQAGLLVPAGGSDAAGEQRIGSEEIARARDRMGALAVFLREGAALLERYGSGPTAETPPPSGSTFTPARLFLEVRAEMESDDHLLGRQRATLQRMRDAFAPESRMKVQQR